MRKLWYELRCATCELLISWALDVAPDDYIHSMTLASEKMYKEGLEEGRKQCRAG